MGGKEAMLPQEGQVEGDIVTHEGVMPYEAGERSQKRGETRSGVDLPLTYASEALDIIREGAVGVDQAGPGI